MTSHYRCPNCRTIMDVMFWKQCDGKGTFGDKCFECDGTDKSRMICPACNECVSKNDSSFEELEVD